MFAISSRNSVPPSASSKQPVRSARASMNAPLTWPNSSLSRTPSESPPELTAMNARPARADLLAGAVLAGHEHARAGRRHALDERHHRRHRPRPRDHRRQLGLPGARGLGVEPVRRPQRPRQLELRVQRGEQPRVVPRLLQVVARAAPHRLDGALDRSPRRHHDDRQRRIDLAQAREQVHALLAGGGVARVVEIEQADVEVLGLAQRDHGGRRRGGAHLEAVGAREHAHRLEHVGLVIRDQQPRSGGHGAAYPPRRSSTTRPSNRCTTRVALRA
jgi:hypothetical protein